MVGKRAGANPARSFKFSVGTSAKRMRQAHVENEHRLSRRAAIGRAF